jgi:hypothetical protein
MNNLEQQRHSGWQVAGRVAWAIAKAVGRSLVVAFLVIGAVFSKLRKEP